MLFLLQLAACSLSGGESILSPDMASLEDKEALDEVSDYINDHFSEAIASLDPDKQREVDAILRYVTFTGRLRQISCTRGRNLYVLPGPKLGVV